MSANGEEGKRGEKKAKTYSIMLSVQEVNAEEKASAPDQQANAGDTKPGIVRKIIGVIDSNWIIALATTVYAFFAGWQLLELGQQATLLSENNTMTRHATEAANAAKILPGGSIGSEPVFEPNSSGYRFNTDFQNFGKWDAERVSVGYAVDVYEHDRSDMFPLPCFPKSQQRLASINPTRIEEPPNHCFTRDITIHDGFIRPQMEAIIAKHSAPRLRVYGLIVYWNGLCLRCASFCYYAAMLKKDSSFSGSFHTPCDRLPNCSRFGDYDEATGCLQRDVSDDLGYYPASDDRHITQDPAGHCGGVHFHCGSTPDPVPGQP